MLISDIIRAWKDNDFREGLNEQQRASLPDNPAGLVLSDEELQGVSGAGAAITWTSTSIPATLTLTILTPTLPDM